MPIWLYDVLHTPTGSVDIRLIRDEANVVSPHQGPRVDLQPLSENLADKVQLAQGAEPATSDPTDTTLAKSATCTSKAPSSP